MKRNFKNFNPDNQAEYALDKVSILPHFDGFVPPSVDFDETRKGLRRVPDYFDVDLTSARAISANTQLLLQVAGNSFYVDQNPATVGNATVHFQDSLLGLSTPVYVAAGFACGWPYTQLVIENAAQPGKILRVIYGVDIKIIESAKL